ncbi:MAG: HD-GYP domain-containing protein [Gemmatimonadaceae bacterium]|nr:HD-GYP domain-containing protein [Gemmatimonadaceae bacterium]
MNRAAKIYVGLLSLAALAAAFAAFLLGKSPTNDSWKVGITFGLLVALSHLLAFKKTGRSESGSIAFLPLLAAVFVAPTWSTIVSMTFATAIAELAARREPIKAVFNVAQASLAVGLSIVFYLSVGGNPLASGSNVNIAAFSFVLILFVVVNAVALSGVIAASERKRFVSLIKQRGLKTFVYDLYALPFVYVFAWVYLHYGALGSIALVLPIMGVRELYKTNWQLQFANKELLELMVATIEARDPYTSGHSRRVAANTRVICEAMGLRARPTERIVTAALLHDVGKIHEIFGPILSKPGRLSDEEMAIMKTHPVKSEELVGRVSGFKDLLAAVRHHHENWDGSGYPDGVAGEAIPLGSRIIMFADTIDAMTTDRPYRSALSHSAVRAELQKHRGRQFDPTICDLILASDLLNHFTTEFQNLVIERQREAVLSVQVSA